MRVFATRPVKQNAGWNKTLHAQGYATVPLPLLDIKPLTSAPELQDIKNKILNLDTYYGVIFASQNAVEYGVEWMDQYWPQLPLGLHWFAIGAKTAAQLTAHPLLALQKVQTAEDAMNSEDLLNQELLQKDKINGRKILICRGCGGRPTLAETLIERGAIVEYCELYSRGLPDNALSQIAQVAISVDKDIVPVFSGEALTHFSHLIKPLHQYWQDIRIVVPGVRVTALAKTLGFTRVFTAVNASENSMLEALNRAAQLH